MTHSKFEDTVKNLLKMPPKPHKPAKAGEEPGPDEPGQAGERTEESKPSDR